MGVTTAMLTTSQGQNNFGYSNNGQTGGYSAQAPPASYQQPSQPGTTPSFHGSTSSYQSSGQHHAPSSQYTSSYSSTGGPSPHGQSYAAPPHGQSQPYGQPSYGASPAVPAAYGQHSQPHYSQPQYSSGGSGSGHSGYPPQPQYASGGGHHQGYGGSGQYH